MVLGNKKGVQGMRKMNKTEKNLQKVWEHLDNACGSLDNALTNLSMMVISDDLKEEIERIDITKIVSLKSRIEELLEK
jgi:hypothetical protein